MKLEFCTLDCRTTILRKTGNLPPCACGTGHKVNPYSDQLVHWSGKHWTIYCLTEHLINKQEQNDLTIRILHKRMKKHHNNISNLPCANYCNDKAGRNYKIIGDAVYCSHCFHDLGGEG